jgi:hypothetical protein
MISPLVIRFDFGVRDDQAEQGGGGHAWCQSVDLAMALM